MITIIKNGKIITPTGIIKNQYLIIENNIIKEIKPSFDKNKKYKIIDAKNNYVSPGFFDIHIHGANLTGFEYKDEKSFLELCTFLLENGISTFLPTLICNENYIKNLVKNINSNPDLKKRIPGIYLEGPFINLERKGGINPKYIKKPNLDYLKKIIDISDGYLKMMTISPEITGIEEIINYLSQNNIIPAYGHSNALLTQALNNNNVKNITHLFNAMSGISHKNPGLASLPFLNQNIFVELNGDGIHIDKNIIKMCYNNINKEKLILITDAVISAGLSKGEYIYDTDKKVISSDRGVRYKSSDILMGSNFLIPDILRNVQQITNANIVDLIKTVTINPATLLGIEKEKGSIKPGKYADIIIFDSNFKIQEILLS